MLAVLTDRSARLNVGDRGSAPQLKVLSALEVFGTNLDDCLHMVVPAVMKVISQVTFSLAQTFDLNEPLTSSFAG